MGPAVRAFETARRGQRIKGGGMGGINLDGPDAGAEQAGVAQTPMASRVRGIEKPLVAIGLNCIEQRKIGRIGEAGDRHRSVVPDGDAIDLVIAAPAEIRAREQIRSSGVKCRHKAVPYSCLLYTS